MKKYLSIYVFIITVVFSCGQKRNNDQAVVQSESAPNTEMPSSEPMDSDEFIDESKEVVEEPAGQYESYEGIYQVYLSGSAMDYQGLNMYYVLNRNGVVLMGFGENESSFLSTLNVGIQKGFVTTGTYEVSGGNISMNLDGASRITNWQYDAANKSMTNEKMELRFSRSL